MDYRLGFCVYLINLHFPFTSTYSYLHWHVYPVQILFGLTVHLLHYSPITTPLQMQLISTLSNPGKH